VYGAEERLNGRIDWFNASGEMIPITEPFLPPRNEYDQYLNGIWTRNWLTNNGPLVNELEAKLREYLGIEHLLFLGNGTIAIQIAIKGLGLKGEIITTPFSYVATTSSIAWEGCEPVFVDVDPLSFNIDPGQIEAAITPRTSAILATHVYGNPCDIEAIRTIASKHGLKVIYDGAHCFGTRYRGRSVFEYGDVTTVSFHATKLFHTIEGGGVMTQDPRLLKKMAGMRNFGHSGAENFSGIGINGKNSEFHAAMGLANLNYIDAILAKRKNDHAIYDQRLSGLKLVKPKVAEDAEFNYAYYSLVFDSEQVCLVVFNELKKHQIFARRYFYPLLSSLDYVNKKHVPVAESIAKRVLCLPLSFQITPAEIDRVCKVISGTLTD
jgi:dTDP-4-amino-4,6-dideoxygalactose transaminase